MNRHDSFTLIEMLVVIAIIGTLGGVMYSVLAQGKERAHQATCLSNLRQCGAALRMYMDDNGTHVPPVGSVAEQVLAKAPTCCPNDKEWTKGCTEKFDGPLIGSYFYCRSIVEPDEDPEFLNTYFRSERCMLMADVFHGSKGIPAPLRYEDPLLYLKALRKAGAPSWRWRLPDKILFLYQDGHTKVKKIPRASDYSVFDWRAIEMEMAPK